MEKIRSSEIPQRLLNDKRVTKNELPDCYLRLHELIAAFIKHRHPCEDNFLPDVSACCVTGTPLGAVLEDYAERMSAHPEVEQLTQDFIDASGDCYDNQNVKRNVKKLTENFFRNRYNDKLSYDDTVMTSFMVVDGLSFQLWKNIPGKRYNKVIKWISYFMDEFRAMRHIIGLGQPGWIQKYTSLVNRDQNFHSVYSPGEVAKISDVPTLLSLYDNDRSPSPVAGLMDQETTESPIKQKKKRHSYESCGNASSGIEPKLTKVPSPRESVDLEWYEQDKRITRIETGEELLTPSVLLYFIVHRMSFYMLTKESTKIFISLNGSVCDGAANHPLAVALQDFGDEISQLELYQKTLASFRALIDNSCNKVAKFVELIERFVLGPDDIVLYDRIIMVLLLTTEMIVEALAAGDSLVATEYYQIVLDNVLRTDNQRDDIMHAGWLELRTFKNSIVRRNEFSLLADHTLVQGKGRQPQTLEGIEKKHNQTKPHIQDWYCQAKSTQKCCTTEHKDVRNSLIRLTSTLPSGLASVSLDKGLVEERKPPSKTAVHPKSQSENAPVSFSMEVTNTISETTDDEISLCNYPNQILSLQDILGSTAATPPAWQLPLQTDVTPDLPDKDDWDGICFDIDSMLNPPCSRTRNAPTTLTCAPATSTCYSSTPTCSSPPFTCPPATPTSPPSTLTCPPATPTSPPSTLTCPPATPTCPPATLTCPPATPACPPATPTCPPATPTCPPATPTCNQTDNTILTNEQLAKIGIGFDDYFFEFTPSDCD